MILCSIFLPQLYYDLLLVNIGWQAQRFLGFPNVFENVGAELLDSSKIFDTQSKSGAHIQKDMPCWKKIVLCIPSDV